MSLIINLDTSILLWLQELRGPLDGFFRFITHLGDSGYFWIAVGIVLLFFRKTRRGGIALLFALLLNLFITNIWLKNAIARVRPYDMIDGLESLIGEMSSFSFPSGHTSSSFAAAAALAMTLGKRFGVPALILAAIISLSRLYVGVHYPTDVLAGVVIGIICAFISSLIFKKRERRKHK